MALEQLALPLITISDIFGKLLSISKDQSTTAPDDDDENSDDCDDEDVFCMIVSICRGPTRLNSTIALLSLIMASPNCIATLQSTVYVHLCNTLKNYVLIRIVENKKTSEELRMLSRSLSDCQSLNLKVLIRVSQFVKNS